MFTTLFILSVVGFVYMMYVLVKPWLLVVFLLLGGVAGILNVYRFVKSEENKKKE